MDGYERHFGGGGNGTWGQIGYRGMRKKRRFPQVLTGMIALILEMPSISSNQKFFALMISFSLLRIQARTHSVHGGLRGVELWLAMVLLLVRNLTAAEE